MTASALPGPGRYSIYTGRVTNWPMVVILGAALTVPLLVLGSVPETLRFAGSGSWPGGVTVMPLRSGGDHGRGATRLGGAG